MVGDRMEGRTGLQRVGIPHCVIEIAMLLFWVTVCMGVAFIEKHTRLRDVIHTLLGISECVLSITRIRSSPYQHSYPFSPSRVSVILIQ